MNKNQNYKSHIIDGEFVLVLKRPIKYCVCFVKCYSPDSHKPLYYPIIIKVAIINKNEENGKTTYDIFVPIDSVNPNNKTTIEWKLITQEENVFNTLEEAEKYVENHINQIKIMYSKSDLDNIKLLAEHTKKIIDYYTQGLMVDPLPYNDNIKLTLNNK